MLIGLHSAAAGTDECITPHGVLDPLPFLVIIKLFYTSFSMLSFNCAMEILFASFDGIQDAPHSSRHIQKKME